MSAFPKGTLEVQREEVRERGLAPRKPGERERECVCVRACVRVRVRLRERERERESVCVDADAGACDTRRGETIRGAAPRELGTDKQKGALQ